MAWALPGAQVEFDPDQVIVDDIGETIGWLRTAVDAGILTADEARARIGYAAMTDEQRQQAAAGGMLSAAEIGRAYEDCIGKPVAASTVYRLLALHGWRKVSPRPRHPKADPAAQAAFKKTAHHAAP